MNKNELTSLIISYIQKKEKINQETTEEEIKRLCQEWLDNNTEITRKSRKFKAVTHVSKYTHSDNLSR